MSNAGRPSNRIPPTNGNGNPDVPPDLEYPCTIYSCTGSTEHDSECDETCESFEPTENQVRLQNIVRACAREKIPINGTLPNLPFPGIPIDPIDIVARLHVLEEFMFEHEGIDRDAFDEMYRAKKVEILTEILEENREEARKRRTADKLGIVQKAILGPDGKPL